MPPVCRPPVTDPRVLVGDCRVRLAELPASSVHAVVTDPPYGIRFMGMAWDGQAIAADTAADRERRRTLGPDSASRPGRAAPRSSTAYGNAAGQAGAYDFSVAGNRRFQQWCEEWATEAFRVLVPGGYLVAFGGTRTWHRLACGVEDAGFEVRDNLAWLFAQGFPKSLNVQQAAGQAVCQCGQAVPYDHDAEAEHDLPDVSREDVPTPSGAGGRPGPVLLAGVPQPGAPGNGTVSGQGPRVTPPGGVVLDPFLGSGATAEAAELEGFWWLGCERSDGEEGRPDYLPLITQRLARVADGTSPGLPQPRHARPVVDPAQPSLFG